MVIGISEGEKIEKIYEFEEIMKNINVESQESQQTGKDTRKTAPSKISNY